MKPIFLCLLLFCIRPWAAETTRKNLPRVVYLHHNKAAGGTMKGILNDMAASRDMKYCGPVSCFRLQEWENPSKRASMYSLDCDLVAGGYTGVHLCDIRQKRQPPQPPSLPPPPSPPPPPAKSKHEKKGADKKGKKKTSSAVAKKGKTNKNKGEKQAEAESEGRNEGLERESKRREKWGRDEG